MKPLLCFDVDGTLECKEEDAFNGPISLETLEELSKNNMVCIVSPSPYHPKMSVYNESLDSSVDIPRYPIFADYGSDTYRHQNLMDACKWYVEMFGDDPPLKLYVSDNGDYKEAEKAGFIYVDSSVFAKGFNI